MGARYALRSRTAGAFIRERLGRLGVPLLTGLVLLVAPMFYLSRVDQPGFHESYWRFWLRFLNPAAIAAGIPARGTWRSGGDEFDPAHLWFLFSLLVFSIVLTPAFVSLRRPRGARLIDRLAGLTERHPAPILLVAAVPIMAVEAALGPDKNTGGWERLTYLFFFLYGYLLASDRRFEQTLRRLRWWALGCAVLASVLLAMAAKILDPSGPDVVSAASPPVSAAQGLAGWMWTAAILGIAGTVAARLTTARPAGRPDGSPASASRWRRLAHYGNEAVLPFYVLHEPVIVAVAWVIVRWSAPLLIKYLSVVACVVRPDPGAVRGTGPAIPADSIPVRHEACASHQADGAPDTTDQGKVLMDADRRRLVGAGDRVRCARPCRSAWRRPHRRAATHAAVAGRAAAVVRVRPPAHLGGATSGWLCRLGWPQPGRRAVGSGAIFVMGSHATGLSISWGGWWRRSPCPRRRGGG
jgi:hypothetical protein